MEKLVLTVYRNFFFVMLLASDLYGGPDGRMPL